MPASPNNTEQDIEVEFVDELEVVDDLDSVVTFDPTEKRPFQFRVRHLMFFLLAAGLISGVIHNFSSEVATALTVLFSIGAPVFVLMVVVAMAIRPVFSFPWKLANDSSLAPDDSSPAEEGI